ncbi:CpXC domain-containing protein [Candidatus Eisenbacteria bacterium]|uniref:CpXC domain-containing protein n=1 Tax=Eiseniibacteriota bacterium TaxID=2212470 RepID=A0ABV6YNX4_UNCEI
MSTGGNVEITCECGHTFEGWLWQSANVTASPDLRGKILAGQLNLVTCPSCERRFYVEVPFLYHDMAAREWIWVYPLSEEQQGGAIRTKVEEMWERLKSTLPEDARQVFEEEYRVLILFGMDALVYYLQGKKARESESLSN